MSAVNVSWKPGTHNKLSSSHIRNAPNSINECTRIAAGPV